MHFDRLKRATVKPRVHKLSESELEPSPSSAEEEDLSDFTPIYRRPEKPVNSKPDAAKPQAPLEKRNARAMTPCKVKPAKDAPEAPATPKVEAALVAKQATLAKQEGPGPGPPGLASAPAVAPKVDKAKRVKPKPTAPPLAPEHPTRTSERSNKGLPPPRLGFQSAILIIALLPIIFRTALGQYVINLLAYGAVSEVCGKIAMDEGPSLFFMIMRLEIPKENISNTKGCYDYAAAIMKDENYKQIILSWMDTDIPTTVTST